MANNQPLSPQGYNIKDEPYNTNPFWGDDGTEDPSIYTRLTALEDDVEDLEALKADKSDLNDYYTKTEITDIVNNIPLFDSTLYDTKSQVNSKITNANIEVLDTVSANYYNKSEVDNKLAVKANVSAFSSYYNKTDIDGIVDGLDEDIADVEAIANQASSDVGDLTSAVNTLSSTVGTNTNNITNLTTRVGEVEGAVSTLETSKADASSVYTKQEIEGKILTINSRLLNKNSIVENTQYTYTVDDTEFQTNLNEGQWFLMDSANHETFDLCHAKTAVSAGDTMEQNINWEYWTIEQEILAIRALFTDYYTKQEVYNKTEVYTKAEVDALIQGE